MGLSAEVYHKQKQSDPQSPLCGEVQIVSSLIQPVLAMDGDGMTACDRVANALGAAYPGKVTVGVHVAHYKTIWNGDHWCLRCCDLVTCEVDFGAPVTVVVAIEEGEHYDPNA